MESQFDQVVDRADTLSVKWNKDAIKQYCANPDAEPFWVADMDFRAAKEIQDAALSAAKSGIYGYPHFEGVKEAFCDFANRRHGTRFTPGEVVTFPGVLVSISMLMQLLTREDDGVIVPLPAYKPFMDITRNLNRKLIPWPMRYNPQNHRFALDWENFDTLAGKAKLVVFCSPQNPTGDVFGRDELEKLARKAAEHHLAVISDEIHADLSYAKHLSMAEVAKDFPIQCAVCMAPSKTFNVAGEHFSVVVTRDEELRNRMEAMKEQNRIGETSFFSTTVALAAYRHGYDWLMELIPYLEGNAALIESYLSDHCPGLAFVKPNASFVGLIDCSQVLPLLQEDEKAHPELYDPKLSPMGGTASRFFGIRARVCCNDGTWFGGGDAYRGFVRFNYGVRRASVLEAIRRMAEAVNQLKRC